MRQLVFFAITVAALGSVVVGKFKMQQQGMFRLLYLLGLPAAIPAREGQVRPRRARVIDGVRVVEGHSTWMDQLCHIWAAVGSG